MKNKFTYLSVILLSALLFVISCKKDNVDNINQKQDANNYSRSVINRIENFRQQMQGHYKNGTLMSLDTAVWNLEALLTNFGGYPDSAAEDYLLMHARFTLTVDANNMATGDDVQALYQQMVDTITAQLNGMAGNVKFLRFSDVQQDSVVGNTAYLSSNNGYGTGLILGMYTPFDDDWIWGTLGPPPQGPFAGNCDQTDFSSDGSNEIEYRLNHQAVSQEPVLYTDLETKSMTGVDFEDDNGQPRLFFSTDGDHCMDKDELMANLVNANDIINTYTPDGLRPLGKDFISVSIVDDITVPSYTTYYLHHYYVTYGLPYTNPIE